jgi:hypothetical protein
MKTKKGVNTNGFGQRRKLRPVYNSGKAPPFHTPHPASTSGQN